jgi:peptidoglycan/LPS O-acetylase OafA/YrhL
MGERTRIEVLDWLRGFAALAVLWYHFTTQSGFPLPGWISATGHKGWLGVEVFFVISGFVIPYSMHAGGYAGLRDAPRFVAKRLVRLEPPYLASIAVLLGIAYGIRFIPGFRGTWPHIDLPGLVLHLGYLNAYFGQHWLNPVFWTLAVEFQFYIAMAILYPTLASRRPLVGSATLGLMVALSLLLPFRTQLWPYLGLFALGAVAFQVRSGLCRPRLALALAAILTGAVVAGLGPQEAVAGALTFLCAAFANVPRIRPLAALGTISYSVYLLHTPVGGRVLGVLRSRIPHKAAFEIGALGLAIAVTLGAAWAMYLLIERPSQRLSSRLRYSPVQERGTEAGAAKAAA